MITNFKLFESYKNNIDLDEWNYRMGVKEVYHWTGYKSLNSIPWSAIINVEKYE